MIDFKTFELENGLRVIVHEDHSRPTVVLNLIYDVGSRDEDPAKTGFAHLFEHLMFGGSANIPSFDEPLQRVGGENNAFTSPDVTNYYTLVPAANIETAFWLESDRMLSLSFDQKVLDVQKSVVIEEFKQRYLNQPYGDAWLTLRPMVYTHHPYAWPTIGKELSHIENVVMDQVREFFYSHYLPNNAVLVLGGDITLDKAKELSKKWFGPIPAGSKPLRALPAEPVQKEARRGEMSGDVPMDAFYRAYHMCGRWNNDFFATDLLCDILGRGKSSRLYDKLVNTDKIFHSLQSYVTSSFDPGLIVIDGKLKDGITVEEGERRINEVIQELLTNGVTTEELEKVKNQAESTLIFSESELLNRVMSLAFAALEGDPNLANGEVERLRAVTKEQVGQMATQVLKLENSSTLIYRSKKK
ncbi:MAG: insulinase family protein [Cytophagaceae bacterium]|nr:insulinase family protein [Cytophagaceae bacterium]